MMYSLFFLLTDEPKNCNTCDYRKTIIKTEILKQESVRSSNAYYLYIER